MNAVFGETPITEEASAETLEALEESDKPKPGSSDALPQQNHRRSRAKRPARSSRKQ